MQFASFKQMFQLCVKLGSVHMYYILSDEIVMCLKYRLYIAGHCLTTKIEVRQVISRCDSALDSTLDSTMSLGLLINVFLCTLLIIIRNNYLQVLQIVIL